MSTVQNIPSGGATHECDLTWLPRVCSISGSISSVLHSVSWDAGFSLHRPFRERLPGLDQGSTFLLAHCSPFVIFDGSCVVYFVFLTKRWQWAVTLTNLSQSEKCSGFNRGWGFTIAAKEFGDFFFSRSSLRMSGSVVRSFTWPLGLWLREKGWTNGPSTWTKFFYRNTAT
jgi:hypothetical protein